MSEGSLLRLFQSEYFTITHLLHYLDKRTEPGIHSFLVNKLYTFRCEEVLPYLPQLLNICLHRPESIPLERYFLDASIRSHEFALKLYWLLQAWMEDNIQTLREILERMLHDLEIVIVNGELPARLPSKEQPPHLIPLDIPETEAERFTHKQARADYFNAQHKFAATLCRLSIILFPIKFEERDMQLQSSLHNIDVWLKDLRFKYSESYFSEYTRRLFRGIHIPFNFEQDPDTAVMQIVRIPDVGAMCFRTKSRVPYKMLVETIDINEEDPEDTYQSMLEEVTVQQDDRYIIRQMDEGTEARGTSETLRRDFQQQQEMEDHIQSPVLPEVNPEALTDDPDGEQQNSPGVQVNPWGESWEDVKQMVRSTSPFGRYRTWKLRAFIVKGQDDLRQEYLAMQLIKRVKQIFEEANLSLFLQPYNILVVSENSGIIECITNATSLHLIKANSEEFQSLLDFFLKTWETDFEEMQKNFVESVAGYSLICYLFNIKDRHNGNILLDTKGHMIHIDFGFFLTNSPGKNINFESVPFKLTREMIEVMGGYDSELFNYFKVLLVKGFMELRKYVDEIALLVEMMLPGEQLPCLQDKTRAIRELREKFHLNTTDSHRTRCGELEDSEIRLIPAIQQQHIVSTHGGNKMDEASIVSALQSGLNPDGNLRNQGEQYLASIESLPGYVQALCHIAFSDYAFEVRLMASILVKNVTDKWADSKKDFSLSAQDIQYLRANILEFLCIQNLDKIRAQFEEVVCNFLRMIFPIEGLEAALNQKLSEEGSLYGGLLFIYQVCRVFEFKSAEKREPFYLFIQQYAQSLVNTLVQLIQNVQEQSFLYILLIVKIFWAANYIEFPPVFTQVDQLTNWTGCLLAILNLPLGNLQNVENYRNTDTNYDDLPAWQCKKFAAQIAHRIFYRYYDFKTKNPIHKQIGEFFVNNWANVFLNTLLNLYLSCTTQFVSSLTLCYCIKYISHATRVETTKQMVSSNAQRIINELLLPMIRRVPEDEITWQQDPIEFIRRETDIGKAYYSPKSATVDLLIQLSKIGHLNEILQFIHGQLQNATLIDKEALLLMIGALQQDIMQTPFASQLEQFLITYVLPDFSSEVGFLRMRACWCYGQFIKLEFASEHQQSVAQQICAKMNDPELPVRFQAANALPRILSWEVAKQLIAPETRDLLQTYLRLMDEISSEDLVDSLESIVETFEKEILPFALELCGHLINNFFQLQTKSSKDEEGEGTMAAVSTLNAINKIVDAAQKNPELLAQLGHLLIPVFDHALGPRGSEFFEEAIALLTCLLYYSPAGTIPDYVKFIPYFCQSLLGGEGFKPYGFDNVEDIFSPLANFLGKYNDLALAYLPQLFSLVQFCLKEDYAEIALGTKLLIAILENSHGKVDQFVPSIITEVITKMQSTESKTINVLCAQVICVSLWYDTALTLQTLVQSGNLDYFFQFLFNNLSKFEYNFSTSHAAIGICKLLQNAEILPDLLSRNLPQITKNIMALLHKLYEAEGETHVIGEEAAGGTTMVDADTFEADFDNLVAQAKAAREMAEEEEDDDSDASYIDDSEDLYDSPFEAMVDVKIFKEVLEQLQARNPELYGVAISTLTQEDMTALQKWISENCP